MAEYLDLVGKPYEKGGNGPDAYDCAGVVREYLRRLGKTVPPDAFDGPTLSCWELRGSLVEVTPNPGDVILSLTEAGELHVDVALDTIDPMTLTAAIGRGVLVRRAYSIGSPLGVYRLLP